MPAHTGLAISVPIHHHEATDLPIGVQIVAAPWREDLLLQVSRTLELAHPWTIVGPHQPVDQRASARRRHHFPCFLEKGAITLKVAVWLGSRSVLNEMRRQARVLANFAQHLAEDVRSHPERKREAAEALAAWCKTDLELLPHTTHRAEPPTRTVASDHG